MQDSAPPTFVDRPSKSARKRDAHELQSLGEALVELPADRLAALAIGDSLRNAIDEYRRTRSHEGRRRQMQLIGKLMRNEEVEPLREAVADYKLGGARDALALHQAERWRAELVAGDEAVDRWMASHPQSDRQQLRALVRNARKDAGLPPEQRHGRAWRELFQWIKPQLKHSDE
jgi:ribosome-associated protein